jgi:hypothetical protein
VGTINVGFEKVALGRIIYTLDGSEPNNGKDGGVAYQEGQTFPIAKTTTLKSIHYIAGLASNVVATEFLRAKAPIPVSKSGGVTSFYPAVTCTLTVVGAANVFTIRYTTDGTAPTAASPPYTAPLTFTKSTTLRALATGAGYDDGDPMQVPFTLLIPAATPTADPAGKSFDKPFGIKLKTVTAGATIRYTIGPDSLAKMDTAHVLTGDSVLMVGKTPEEHIFLRAMAVKAGIPSSAIMTEKYSYLPQVLAPTPALGAVPLSFYDSSSVTFASPTPGAVIHYTAGTTTPPVPTASSPVANGPIHFSGDTVISAIAIKSPLPQSAVVTNSYTLMLTQPVADKGSRQFKDTLTVKLSALCPGARIFYTLDGTVPTTQSAPYTSPISLSKDDTTSLHAIAVKGAAKSVASSYTYVKTAVIVKLAAPVIDPVGREFMDSLKISLRTDDTDAEIR